MKSARAVLILIPIFGVHFLLIPMRPETGSQLEYVYEVVFCISTSTQGLSVSFLLCFCNSDVSSLIKKRFFHILNNIGSHFITDFSIGHDVSIQFDFHLLIWLCQAPIYDHRVSCYSATAFMTQNKIRNSLHHHSCYSNDGLSTRGNSPASSRPTSPRLSDASRVVVSTHVKRQQTSPSIGYMP